MADVTYRAELPFGMVDDWSQAIEVIECKCECGDCVCVEISRAILPPRRYFPRNFRLSSSEDWRPDAGLNSSLLHKIDVFNRRLWCTPCC